MITLPTPEQFLTDCFKDLLNTKDPTDRPALIKGYARLMQLRESQLIDWIIETNKEIVSTTESLASDDLYCKAREDLRDEQRKRKQELLGGDS